MNKTSKILKVVGLCVMAAVLVALASLFIWMTTAKVGLDGDMKSIDSNLNQIVNTRDGNTYNTVEKSELVVDMYTTLRSECVAAQEEIQKLSDDLDTALINFGKASEQYADAKAKLNAYIEYADALENWRKTCPCLFIVEVDENNIPKCDKDGKYIIKDVTFKPGEGLKSLADWIITMPTIDKDLYTGLPEEEVESPEGDEKTAPVELAALSGNK